MFDVLIKSGTCGWSDYDNCDKCVAEIPSNNIPSNGDILEVFGISYLVREVKRVYNLSSNFKEFIHVYVIKI